MRLSFLAISIFVYSSLHAQSSSKITIVPPQTDATTGSVDFREKYANGQNYVGWQAPANIRSSFRLTLPDKLPRVSNSLLALSTTGIPSYIQAPATSMADTVWSQTITDNLTTPGTHTITLSPAPLGVSAAITDSQYRLTGAPGAAELVTPTGNGTCNGTIQDSCTLEVITAQSHTTSVTLGTSTAGLQESWNAGRSNVTCPDGIHMFYGTAKTGLLNATLTGTPYCTLAPAASNMTVLWANSIYAITIRGISFNSLGTATNVTYILVGSGSNSTGSSVFANLRISASSGGYGIDARRGHELHVSDCLFHQTTTTGGGSAILVGSIVHGDLFAGWFTGNTIIGDWKYGIEDHGSGLIGYKNGFNGPKNHLGFQNWLSVVDVNGTSVTWVSGDTFDLSWPGFVEIDGQIGLITSVNSPTSITLTNNLGVIIGGKLRHGSTGQLQWEGNTHDSGSAYYINGFAALANLNSFYNFRIANNMCTNWINATFTNCIYFGMPNATGVAITGNSIQNSVGTGSHYGINLSDVGDAQVTGNNLLNYTYSGISANITSSNNPRINITGNNVKCNLAASPTYGIVISKGRFNVSGNTIEDCDIGVLGGPSATGLLSGTYLTGTTGTKYQFDPTSTITLTDSGGIAFADLPANTANGTLIYCSNCTPGSSPCTGASTGAMAKRLSGTWQCN